MDTELKNRIIEFIRTIMSMHGEYYPSVGGELDALVDAVSREFMVSKTEALTQVRYELGYIKMG